MIRKNSTCFLPDNLSSGKVIIDGLGHKLLAWVLAAMCLAGFSSCESKHQKLQQQIEQRKAALEHKQDSTLTAAQEEIQRLDSLLQQVKSEYEQKRRAAEAAHEAGTGTEEQFGEVNRLRQLRDSLQVRFDTECAKIRYVKRRINEG